MLAEALDAHRKSAPTWLLYLRLHSLNVRLLRAAGESIYVRTTPRVDFCGVFPGTRPNGQCIAGSQRHLKSM